MIQKRWSFSFLFVLLIMVIGVWIIGDSVIVNNKAMAADQIVLKLSQPTPPTGFYGEGYAYFAKAVEEETNGQVKIEVYPSASLVADSEAFDAVRKGIVDIVHFASAAVSPTVKAMTPFDVPSAYPGERHKELDSATRAILEKVLAQYKIKYLGPGYPETLAFASVESMIKSPADLKGKSIRTSGKWAGEAVKLWSGSPVTIPLGDLPLALQRGVVDAVLTSWIVIDSFKLYETAPHITFTGMQNILTGLYMSEAAWERLNADQQEAVMRAEKRWRDYIDTEYEGLKKEFEERIVESGGSFYNLNDQENAEFKEVRQSLFGQIKPLIGSDGEAIIEALDTIQ